MERDNGVRTYELLLANTNHTPGIVWSIFTGICAFLVFIGLTAAVYVRVFGYGGGHLIFYALHDALGMPLTFETCFRMAHFPVINIVVFLIAAYVFMWKVLY